MDFLIYNALNSWNKGRSVPDPVRQFRITASSVLIDTYNYVVTTTFIELNEPFLVSRNLKMES